MLYGTVYGARCVYTHLTLQQIVYCIYIMYEYSMRMRYTHALYKRVLL